MEQKNPVSLGEFVVSQDFIVAITENEVRFMFDAHRHRPHLQLPTRILP